MNDLISRKDAEGIIHDYFSSLIDKNVTKVDIVDCNADLQKSLDNLPTAYNPDKVVEELEEEKECAYADFEFYTKDINLDEEYDDYYHCGLSRAIDIVKRGGVE